MAAHENVGQMLNDHFRKIFFNKTQRMAVLRVEDPFSRVKQEDLVDNDKLVPVSYVFANEVPKVEFERFNLYRHVDITISPVLESHYQISTVRNFKADIEQRVRSTRHICDSIVEMPSRPIDRLSSDLLLLRQRGIVYYYIKNRLSKFNPNTLIAACIHAIRDKFDPLTGLTLLSLAKDPHVLEIILEQLRTPAGTAFAEVLCLSRDRNAIMSTLPAIQGLPKPVISKLRNMRFEVLERDEEVRFAEMLD